MGFALDWGFVSQERKFSQSRDEEIAVRSAALNKRHAELQADRQKLDVLWANRIASKTTHLI